MKEIYDKIQDINIILKRSFIDLGKPLAYQEVIEKSAKVLESSLFIIDTKRNCLGYGFTDSDNSYIEGNHLRLGTLFLLTDSPLEEEKRILVDFLSTFIGNQMSYIMLAELEGQRRNETFVSLVQSLYRSELEAFKNIIEKIDR